MPPESFTNRQQSGQCHGCIPRLASAIIWRCVSDAWHCGRSRRRGAGDLVAMADCWSVGCAWTRSISCRCHAGCPLGKRDTGRPRCECKPYKCVTYGI